jgi:hypothetical protein
MQRFLDLSITPCLSILTKISSANPLIWLIHENGGGGPLFVNENTITTQGGYSVIDRKGTDGDGKELHRGMLSIQQAILDNVYNTWTASSCSSVLQDHG